MAKLSVRTVSRLDDFIALKPQWDALAASMENSLIFLTHDWIRIWIESFIPDKPLHIILVYDEARLVGILPLYKEIFTTLKIVRQVCLHSLTNSCSAVSGPVARLVDMPRVLEAVFLYLGQDQRIFSRIILEFVPGDLGIVQFFGKQLGWARVSLKPWEGSYYLNIDGDHDSYMKSLGKSFRKSLRQKSNQLERSGGGRWQVFHQYDPEVFQRFLDLEDTGWKRERGRPIKNCSKSTGFFRRVAQVFGAQGQLIMQSLSIDDQPVAMQFAVVFNGICHALKNAMNYAEADASRFSPGNMIDQAMVRYCFDRKLRRLDFYGYCYPYQAHWTKTINRKYEIMIIKKSDLLTRACLALKDFFRERFLFKHSWSQREASKTV